MKKIIFIAGATASGKSDLGIKIAKKFGGEIISADSRQVYKNIPIFSGAVLPDEMDGVPHHILSFLEEEENFSSFDFSKLANQKIKEIIERGNIPIVVGGSSFYFENLIFKNTIPAVKPNAKLRRELEKRKTDELFEILCAKDKIRAENIDAKNRPRLIRAIEICHELGKVPVTHKKIRDNFSIFFVWLNQPIEAQREKIKQNFTKRMKQGFLQEASRLKDKLNKTFSEINTEARFLKLGLSYKHIFAFWNKEISKEEFIKKGITEEGKYAKRQNTFLKKFYQTLPKKVEKHKYNLLEKDYQEKVLDDVKEFLKS